MTQTEKQLIEKQKELIGQYRIFTKWVLKYEPEIWKSQRGENKIKEIDNLESEIATLEAELEQENCEHEFKPFLDIYHPKRTANRKICIKCDKIVN